MVVYSRGKSSSAEEFVTQEKLENQVHSPVLLAALPLTVSSEHKLLLDLSSLDITLGYQLCEKKDFTLFFHFIFSPILLSISNNYITWVLLTLFLTLNIHIYSFCVLTFNSLNFLLCKKEYSHCNILSLYKL